MRDLITARMNPETDKSYARSTIRLEINSLKKIGMLVVDGEGLDARCVLSEKFTLYDMAVINEETKKIIQREGLQGEELGLNRYTLTDLSEEEIGKIRTAVIRVKDNIKMSKEAFRSPENKSPRRVSYVKYGRQTNSFIKQCVKGGLILLCGFIFILYAYRWIGPSQEALDAFGDISGTPGIVRMYQDDRQQQRYEAEQIIKMQANDKDFLETKETARVEAFLKGNRFDAIKRAAQVFDLEPELIAGFLYEEAIYQDTQNKLEVFTKESFSRLLSIGGPYRGTLGMGQVGVDYMMKKEFLDCLFDNIDYFLTTVKSERDLKSLREFRDFYKPWRSPGQNHGALMAHVQSEQGLIVSLADAEEVNIFATGFIIRAIANQIAVDNKDVTLIPSMNRLNGNSTKWVIVEYKEIPKGMTSFGDLLKRYGAPFLTSYYPALMPVFADAQRYSGGDENYSARGLSKVGAYEQMLKWGGFKRTPDPKKSFVAHFSLYSRSNSLTREGRTDQFQIGETTYTVGEFNKEGINQLGEPVVIPDQDGRNIIFTIRGPPEKNNLAEYLSKDTLLLQEAIFRSQSLYNGGLDQDITIILADKYDYLAGDHRQNNLIILNASDLETMLQQDQGAILVSELIASLLSEELAHERGADGKAETEERLAQDGAHATRYAITHKPYAPTLSEYISFLEKYTLEIKEAKGYLSYLKVMNRYQDMEWTRKFSKLVAERNVCVFHMENALSRQILDNLYNRFLQKGYTKKAAEFAVGRIAQLTMAGGLGNIKRELGDSWSEKGVNPKSFNLLYGRWIKGVGNIDQSLVGTVLETMGDSQFKFKTKIFNRDNVNEEIEVEVTIYRDPFSPSNYWIYCPEIFDGAYPDNKVHLAQQLLLYRKASLEYLLYLHSKGEIKDKFLFSLSEVYTALLIPDVIEDEYSNNPVLKDIFIHHYNHTVVAAGMPKLPQFLYDILHIKEKYRNSVVQYGEIVLADLIGQGSDEITGCSMKHTKVLRENNMAKFKDKISDNITEANSEGAYIDNWQDEEMQKAYERYFLMLEATDDEDLFKKLDENQDIRERFTKDMLLAKERQKQVFKEWQISYGIKLEDGLKSASLTRRMVPYKRLDVITAMLGIGSYMNQLREFKIGFFVGGRHFDIDQSDFGITQLNVINKISEREPGYIATVPDNTDYPGYNIFNAHNIYEGVDATIMLSDEDLEAGPTSPSKGLVNGAIIIATPDGVMSELLIDFNEDSVNGNGFRVEYYDPDIQNMVSDFIKAVDPISKEEILEKGRNGSTHFAFNISRGMVYAESIGLKGFFDTQNRLLFDRVTIFNAPEDYINYMLCLFNGVKGAEEIIAWLTNLRDNKELEAYEKYSDVKSFLIEILGARREPTIKTLFKALKGFNDAWNDPEKKNRLFYNAFKTGMLKANTSTHQGPGLIKLLEEGLERKQPEKAAKSALIDFLDSHKDIFIKFEEADLDVQKLIERGKEFTVVMLDGDSIKKRNEAFGKSIVDWMLLEMIASFHETAKLLDKGPFKINMKVFRRGGDEFGFIIQADGLNDFDVKAILEIVRIGLFAKIKSKYGLFIIDAEGLAEEDRTNIIDELKKERIVKETEEVGNSINVLYAKDKEGGTGRIKDKIGIAKVTEIEDEFILTGSIGGCYVNQAVQNGIKRENKEINLNSIMAGVNYSLLKAKEVSMMPGESGRRKGNRIYLFSARESGEVSAEEWFHDIDKVSSSSIFKDRGRQEEMERLFIASEIPEDKRDNQVSIVYNEQALRRMIQNDPVGILMAIDALWANPEFDKKSQAASRAGEIHKARSYLKNFYKFGMLNDTLPEKMYDADWVIKVFGYTIKEEIEKVFGRGFEVIIARAPPGQSPERFLIWIRPAEEEKLTIDNLGELITGIASKISDDTILEPSIAVTVTPIQRTIGRTFEIIDNLSKLYISYPSNKMDIAVANKFEGTFLEEGENVRITKDGHSIVFYDGGNEQETRIPRFIELQRVYALEALRASIPERKEVYDRTLRRLYADIEDIPRDSEEAKNIIPDGIDFSEARQKIINAIKHKRTPDKAAARGNVSAAMLNDTIRPLLVLLENSESAFDLHTLLGFFQDLEANPALSDPEDMNLFRLEMDKLSSKAKVRIAYNMEMLKNEKNADFPKLRSVFNIPEFYEYEILAQLSIIPYMATYTSSINEIAAIADNRGGFRLAGKPVEENDGYVFRFLKDGKKYEVFLAKNFDLRLRDNLEELFVPNKNVNPVMTNLDSLSEIWSIFIKFYLMALGLEEEDESDGIDFNGKSLIFVGAETPEIPLQIARQFPLSRVIVVNPKWETKKGGNIIVIGDEVQQLAKYKDEIGMVDFVFSSGLFNMEWSRFVVDAQNDSKSVYERMMSPLVEILSPDGIMIISEGPKVPSIKSKLEEAIQAVGLRIFNEEIDIGKDGGIYIIRRANLRNEILERNDSIQAVQSGL
ncbi:MAG: glycogen/starch/alpha-glucan phosphorylase [Candidatus Omnitrophota bacterium]|nr:glycogen/starch/alpha-glucan phosphorylase [Candidatus Omnitrophota bacterium]